MRDRIDVLELGNIWGCGIYQKELETKGVVGQGERERERASCAELWEIAAFAEGKDSYFPSVHAKIPKEMLLELVLELKRSRKSISTDFFLME